MSTLLNAADRETIVTRLRSLEPTRTPAWGLLTAPRLLCHLGDQLRVALGDLPTRRTDNLASRTVLKWVVVYTPVKPPPGKVQTAPEMLSSKPTTWEVDRQAVEVLIERLGATPTNAAHPFFGPLTHDGWGRLCWKHLDHHLRQFGS